MKKKILFLMIAVFAIVSLCAFAGCTDKNDGTGKSSGIELFVESAVFVADGEVMTLTDMTSVKDYMDVLKANGELEFDGSNSEYGFFLTSVYATKAEGNSFWAVYTDLVTIEGDDAVYSNAEYGTYAYKGKMLNSASYGVSSLPCVEGYTYALVYTAY